LSPSPLSCSDFRVAALSSRHPISAGSVVVVFAIAVAIGNEEMGDVVPQKLFSSLLGPLALNVFVAASAPAVEVIMMVSRTALVDFAAITLKLIKPDETVSRWLVAMTAVTYDDGDGDPVIASALVAISSVTPTLTRLECVMTVLVGSAANSLKVDQSPF